MPLFLAIGLFFGGMVGHYAGKLEGQTFVMMVDGRIVEVREGKRNNIDPDGLPAPIYRDINGDIDVKCEICDE